MIVYLALFLIILSPVAISLGIFQNALPAIIIRLVAYGILTYKFRFQLIQLYKKDKIIKYFSLSTFLLLVWGMGMCHNIEEYATCIGHFTIVLFPIWIIMMYQPNHKDYLRFIFWGILFLGFGKYFGKYEQSMNNYGGYTSILYFFIFFLPIIKLRWKAILLVFWVMSLTYDSTDRTHMIMMLGTLVFSILQYTNLRMISFGLYKKICLFGIITPTICIIFFFSGVFNVFSLAESDKLDGIQGAETTNVDTRSSIYKEVIDDQNGIISWVIGKSYIGTYKSNLAETFNLVVFHRLGCEVGILEILIRGGLVYVFLVMILFYRMAHAALCKSSNYFCISLGLFVLLYWIVFFIELQMDAGNWNIALWLAFGLISNPSIRSMTNKEINLYYKNIISGNYL